MTISLKRSPAALKTSGEPRTDLGRGTPGRNRLASRRDSQQSIGTSTSERTFHSVAPRYVHGQRDRQLGYLRGLCSEYPSFEWRKKGTAINPSMMRAESPLQAGC